MEQMVTSGGIVLYNSGCRSQFVSVNIRVQWSLQCMMVSVGCLLLFFLILFYGPSTHFS